MATVALEFLLVAGIVILGFAGEQVFSRTGVPNFLWLIGVGILLGPVSGIFPLSTVASSLGLFAELTLLLVLFYGGMDTKVTALLRGGGRAFFQVVLYVVPSVLLVAAIVAFAFHWSLIQSLIFGSIIGGETTAAVMIPLSRSLRLREQTVAFLTLESAMNSVFSIILFFVFVGAYNQGLVNVLGAVTTLATEFSTGVVAGGVLSLGWVFLLARWKGRAYTYVFTIGLILLTYSVTSLIGGSGELAVLVFGVVLGNYRPVATLLGRTDNIDWLQSQLRTFYGEITFLLETLFFVSLGLAFVIVPRTVVENVLAGLALLGVLVAVRYGAVSVSTFRSELRSEATIITLMCAMGLTPATLAIISVNMGLPHALSYLTLATYVIIFTNVVTAAGSIWRVRKNRYPLAKFTKDLESYLQGT